MLITVALEGIYKCFNLSRNFAGESPTLRLMKTPK